MRRRLLSALLALVVLPMSSGPALALGTLDQEVLPGAFGVSLCCASPTQTFTAGLTGDLDTVALYGSTGIGATWNVSIYATNLGSPTGPALGTGSAAAPGSAGWTEIALTPFVPVVTGTMYAIVVSGPSPSWRFAFPGTYAGGSFSSGGDAAFRTYVTPPPPPPPPPIVALIVESRVAATQDGPSAESLTVPAGSTIWRTVSVVNGGTTNLGGVTLTDSGGLPPDCPALPSSFPAGTRYSCSFSVPAASGLTVYTSTAVSGDLTSIGRAYVTGSIAALASGSRLGLPSGSGDYTPSTKIANLGGYVTWQAGLGVGAAGKTVGVYVARKSSDGTWGAWARLTSRIADAAGVVTFSRRESTPTWLSVRFSLGDESFTSATQARWR